MASSDETKTNPQGLPEFGAVERALREQIVQSVRAAPSIPGYRLVRVLGKGGQGLVFEAEQLEPARRVAIKVFRDDGSDAEECAARFERETDTLANLEHECIVKVYSVGKTDDGRSYFVMPLLDGQAITEYARTLSVRGVAELFAKVCEAMGVVHRQAKLIHRDLKPSNILVEKSGKPVLLDFGLARPMGVLAETITQSGNVMGTAAYMSPEQTGSSSRELDERTDVYSLGVVLFELIAGQRPYEVDGNDWAKSIATIRETEPAAPSRMRSRDGRTGSSERSMLSRDLDTIALKALRKKPSERYANAAEMAEDLGRALRGEGILAERESIVRRSLRFVARRVRRAPVLACCILSVICAFLAGVGSTAVVYLFPQIDGMYRSSTQLLCSPTPINAAMAELRVVGLSAGTDIEALAAEQKIERVRTAEPRSVRRIFGAVLSRLAVARPAVVGLASSFQQESEHDAALLAGVGDLDAARVNTVVQVDSWEVRPDGKFAFAERVSDSVRCGPTSGDVDGQWAIDLVRQPSARSSYQSFALRVCTSADKYGLMSTAQFGANDEIIIQYLRPAKRAGGEPEPGQVEYIRASHIDTVGPTTNKVGVRNDDVVATLLIPPFDTTIPHSIRTEVGDMLRMSDEELRRRFAGRIVLLVDDRDERRVVRCADGTLTPVSTVHVATVAAIRSGVTLRTPTERDAMVVLIGVAAIGVSVGYLLRPGWLWRIAAHLGIVVLIVLASLLVLAGAWYELNPIYPISAALIAVEAGTRVSRIARAEII